MASRIVNIRVEELRGEEGDPSEANINLAVDPQDIPTGPLAGRRVVVDPSFQLLVIFQAETVPPDAEEVGTEQLLGAPQGDQHFLVMSKSLVGGVAPGDTIQGTLYERSDGARIVVEIPEGTQVQP